MQALRSLVPAALGSGAERCPGYMAHLHGTRPANSLPHVLPSPSCSLLSVSGPQDRQISDF